VRTAKEDGASTRYVEFNPEFTYPIFGEQEIAFGYKDLAIQVRESSNLRLAWPNLIEYS
jgi:histone acetyltransferase 1